MSATITPHDPHTLLSWRCDDEPNGFEFHVLSAADGDFHLSVVPSKDHPSAAVYGACFAASVRIRAPMIGGGSHSDLWHALAKLLRAEQAAQQRADDHQRRKERAT